MSLSFFVEVVVIGVILMAVGSIGSAEPVYLSDRLELIASSRQSWGLLGINTGTRPPDKDPLPMKIGSKDYKKGIGTHADSEIIIPLDGLYSRFEAEVGIQSGNPTGSVVFQVFLDGRKAFDSGIVREADAPRLVNIDVTDADEMRLVVKDAGDGIECDAANWAEARLVRNTAVKEDARSHIDIGPFARVVTCDPSRKEGARAGRLEEFRAEDVFLEEAILPDKNGIYTAPVYGDKACIGLQWAERRVLTVLSADFAGETPSTDDVQVEYWSSQGRTDGWATIGQTLWQGEWAKLAGRLEKQDGRWLFHIDSNVLELRSGDGVQKVRWIIPVGKNPIKVQKLGAMTKSRYKTGSFRLELEKPLAGKTGSVEIYNGFITDSKNLLKRSWDLGKPLVLNLQYVKYPKLPDRTVLRIELPDGAFGIAVSDILENGCVWLPDFGLYASTDPQKLTLEQYKKQISGRKTVLERVREMPDQTFEAAKEKLHNPMTKRDPMMLSLACDNNKFIVYREGTIEFDLLSPNGGDAHNYPHVITPEFGSGENKDLTRQLEDGHMPVPVTTVNDAGVTYRQRSFVAPYGKQVNDDTNWLNDKPLGVVEFTLENSGENPAEASLELCFLRKVFKQGSEPQKEPLTEIQSVQDGAVAVIDGRLAVYINSKAVSPLDFRIDGNKAIISGNLPAKSSVQCALYIPRWTAKPEEYASIAGTEDLLKLTKDYWNNLLASSMQVDTPEPLLNDFIRASQIHTFLAARNDENGKLVHPWIASQTYGPLDTESQAVILAMDLFGHQQFAQKSLDYFLSRYNERGCLANGYTLMGTGQNLWTIGEHYSLSRDKDWLSKNAPKLELACRWISDQRKKTMKLDASGEKMPEYGLVPPGVLADWNRYAYYFYANGYYYAGMKAVADMMGDIKPPAAGDVSKEAGRYREDILRAFKWNQARMPALQLSTGEWVPAYPSSVYCFGLTKDFYTGVSSIGHDVEVGANHLLELGVLNPDSKEGDWITNYMEDVWFFLDSELAKYPVEEMKKDWFTYGGFAKLQPYYTRYSDVLALRDDVKPFIRNYFNSFWPMLSLETLALWEHFNTIAAWNKTHETAWFLEQTRMMLLMERGDDLWIAPFVTSSWLENNMSIFVKNAPSRFGNVSYEISSHLDDGYIEALIHAPRRSNPKSIILRLRHPEGKMPREVTVNGVKHEFDRSKECVRIKSGPERMSVVASY